MILKSGLPFKVSFVGFLIVFTMVFLIGCGKKKETQQPSPSNSPAASPESAPAAGAPAPRLPPPPPEPSPTESNDAMVTYHTILHLRSVVSRKDWPHAAEAVKLVEARTLTPEQRRYVDSLKAQIPR